MGVRVCGGSQPAARQLLGTTSPSGGSPIPDWLSISGNEEAALTQEQQLELPPSIPLVPAELSLDLSTNPLGLLILRRQAAPRHRQTNPS